MSSKRIHFLVLFLLSFIVTVAQATFTVSAPTNVSVGEKFAVTFRLKNADGSGLKAPEINGCTKLFGPAMSTSRSFSVINGKTSSTSVTDYTFTYRADHEGQFTIGAASIQADGKTMTTRPMKINISKSASRGSSQQSSAGVAVDDITTQSAENAVSSSDVFVRIILSRPSAYEQEAVECTIKLYTKYSISSFFPTKQPSFDGFLITELDVQPSLNQIEVFNGQRYMTAVLKKCIIYPQKAGKLTINSGNYDINVVQYDQVNMGFFTVQNPKERKIKVSSNSASVNIMPLPVPQPEGFTGAVGQFTVNTRLVGSAFKTYDPATLLYEITGTGNIKYIKEPTIDFPSEFEQYTPKKTDRINVNGDKLSGNVTIEYTFVPKSVGDFKIGGDKFVYFDPNKKQYITLETPSYNIKVAKGADEPKTKEKVNQKNTDILHIVTDVDNMKKLHPFAITSLWYWGVVMLLVIILVAGIYLNRQRMRKASDVISMRNAKANKVARRRLKLARTYLSDNKSDEFFEEVLHATWGYLSDKLAMPLSQLNRDNIVSELQSRGITDDLTQRLIAILDDCEMARYTPSQSHERLQNVYDDVVGVINRLEETRLKPKEVK